jgi:hypothetical protein
MSRPMNIDLQRAIIDYEYYASKVLKIKDQNQQLISLDFWEPQRKFHKVVEEQRRKNGLQRFIILKARREGMSTYSEGRIFWLSHMNENTDSCIIAHEKESGEKIFNMCKLFHDCMPEILKPMTRYSSKRELVFENPDQKTRSQLPGLRSSLSVLTAGKKDVGRGAGYHNLHASELGSWLYPEDVIPSLIPTIPKTLESLVIYESTAKGVGNFFHEEWLAAKEGTSNFVPFFLPWFDLPEYVRQFNSQTDKDAFSERLNDEEKELRSTYGLTLEQLYWRRTTVADLRADVELFRQEFPSNDEEAFIVSGAPVFDRRKLRTMFLKCGDPLFHGRITATGLRPDDHGELKIWKQPESGAAYVIGADVSSGGRYDPRSGKTKGDYSCAEVWKVLPIPFVAEQVAEWHGYVDPVNFAEITAKLGRLYNEAMIAVEAESYGRVTLQELQRNYWNLYRQERVDTYDGQLTKRLGWETSLRSKKALIAFGGHCISDMIIIAHSADFVKELMSFVQDESGGASAAGTGYDDRVMAGLIGLYVLHRSSSDETEGVISSMAPVLSVEKQAGVDYDFERILEYGDYNSHDNHWMNF